MTSSTPPEPDPDESDTGPLAATTPDPPTDGGQWDSSWDEPAQPAWGKRFEAPLTVTPRPVRRQRNLKPLIVAAAVVGAVAVVAGGVVFWLTRPSAEGDEPPSATPPTSAPQERPADAEQRAQLLSQLPKGYPAGACEPADTPEDVLAQVVCERNTDQGGPLSATYTLVADKPALEQTFRATMDTATRVDCPGRIQSPGPWRRNATPDRVSGQLFCGLRDGLPMIAWTDDVKMTVSAVRAGPDGPTFPQLYTWWSKHS
ncbi:hypothetical protein [Mycolicibacterium phlei]